MQPLLGRLRYILPLTILAAILVILMPRTAKWGYDYRIGSSWKYETLVSKFDFPIQKTQEQIDEEKARQTTERIPYYKFADDVLTRSIGSAGDMDFAGCDYVKPYVISSLRQILTKGVISEDKVAGDDSDVIYIQRDRKAVKTVSSEVFTIVAARSRILSDVLGKYPQLNADSLLRDAGVYDLVIPDLIYDQQTTELVAMESDKAVSPTMGYMSAGQVIISSGEIITAETAQILDSYRTEYEHTVGAGVSRFNIWTGNILLAIALVLVLFGFIAFSSRSALQNYNRFLYVLLVYSLAAVAALLVGKSNEQMLFMVPFTMVAIYLHAFFKRKVVLTTYIASLLPLLIFSHNGVVLFMMYLAAGVVAILLAERFNKGWRQFILALAIFAALTIVYVAFWLTGATTGSLLRTILYLFLSSVLTVALYPFIYLFENIFSLVSSSRLLDLCDTSNELLRELEQKAPGTFQHSLQVMNMADACARAAGANSVLIRAGALYHDIGKMNNPLCFVENESLITEDTGAKYHSEISPLQSAQDIIRHVSDGLDLARRHRLPKAVTEFILTHHGTSCVAYFYDKYLKQGGDPAERERFCYNGQKPKSVEQAILMLCDSVEAASRTLTDYSHERISILVENIIASKTGDGQLAEAEISVGQMAIVKETMKVYVAQVHHARVTYPERNKQNH